MAHQIIKVSAPGKIIISGEHSVVYGQPALVSALDKRLYVEIKKGSGQTKILTKENPGLAHHALSVIEKMLNKKINHLQIRIKSDIPVNRGLGSSAALAVALTAALFRWFGKKWNKRKINQIAFEIEKKQHGSPSGVDNTIATFGGTIIFQKGKIKPFSISKFPKFPKIPKLLLLDSGQASESTAEMVATVRRKFQAPPASPSACRGRANSKLQTIIKEMGQTTLAIIKALNLNPPNTLNFTLNPTWFRALITQNQRFLEDLGVVGQKAQKIIREIEASGAAAKICGAGGVKDGSGMLLCYHQEPQVLLKFAQKNNLNSYQLKLGEEGLRNEK